MSIWAGSHGTNEPNQSEQAKAQPGSMSPDLARGEWVGEYVIVRKLGEGGFGAVYEALHPVIGKRAAVKVLHAQYSSDEAVASRFAAEARAVNQIHHKNIVDIFSFGELPDGRQYYVMELLEGAPLDAYLERAVRLELTECLPLLSEIAKALQAAHDAGIAHRDLKPENVFLELDDEHIVHPKILDFGMAKLLAPGALPVHKTRSGTPIGSPRYMSPEQCRGTDVDSRTDVYAFGCMAYRMLAGVPPFDASTALELMMAHVSAPPMPLSSVGPDLGPAIDECLLRMLEKLPENRPQSILDAFDNLKSAASAGRPELVPFSSCVASPLLCQIVEERLKAAPGPIDVTTLRKTPTNSRVVPLSDRRVWLWRVASIALAALVFMLFHQLSQRHRSVTPGATPTTDVVNLTLAPPQPSKESPDSVAPAASQVAITVNAQPARADLYLNDQKVGTAPGPLLLPQSETSHTLVVRSAGYQPQTVTFVPTSNRSLRVVLSPLKARANGDVSRDLENPY